LTIAIHSFLDAARPETTLLPMLDSAPDFPDLLERVKQGYSKLPAQAQRVARWLVERPDDVALLSTREQARSLGVAPATLTRFAKHFGFAGYNALRGVSQHRLRARAAAFAPEARRMVARRKAAGSGALAEGVLAAIAANLDALREPTTLSTLQRAARLLSRGRRIYVLGNRSSYPVAYHFYYVASFAGVPVTLVDGPGGIGIDALRSAAAGDVMFAVSVAPYTRATVEAVAHATARRVGVIALTDSPLSPLAARARAVLAVPTMTPSFFHSMSAAFALAEALAALVVAERGPQAVEATQRADHELRSLCTYLGAERATHRRAPATGGKP
jgi:DNA-binding MurR/RpiR family transcriptional regulator